MAFSLLSVAFGVLLAGVTLWPGRLLRSTEPAITLTVQTRNVPLGGTALVRVEATGAQAVTVIAGEHTYTATPDADGRWLTAIGVYRDEKPGSRAVTAKAVFDEKALTANGAFNVTARTFPTQRLRMSRAESSKYEAPSMQEEYRLIRAALARETTRQWQGGFRIPTAGRISTHYGTQRYRNGEKVSVHKGIDVAAPGGQLIYAANAGTVVLRRKFGMHGHTIAIDHGGGVVSIYLHLRDFGVSEGQVVQAGQKIGRVGDTGVATRPHLHYALYVHGTAIDPLLMKTVPEGW